MMKQMMPPLIRLKRLKQWLMAVILMSYLNQSIVRLYETYKNHWKNWERFGLDY